jgi:hypothetical protein
MERPQGKLLKPYEGVHDLLEEQVKAYLSNRNLEVYPHFRTEVGKSVDKWRYRSTIGAW